MDFIWGCLLSWKQHAYKSVAICQVVNTDLLFNYKVDMFTNTKWYVRSIHHCHRRKTLCNVSNGDVCRWWTGVSGDGASPVQPYSCLDVDNEHLHQSQIIQQTPIDPLMTNRYGLQIEYH